MNGKYKNEFAIYQIASAILTICYIIKHAFAFTFQYQTVLSLISHLLHDPIFSYTLLNASQ